jgi:PAS domain S-box-containing protein
MFKEEHNKYGILGYAFLVVAIFNFLHTIFFMGLDNYFSSEFNLSWKYWIMGRLIEGTALLIFTLKLFKDYINRWLGLSIAVVFSSLIGGIIYYYPGSFLDMATNGGLSAGKFFFEYVIIILYLISFSIIIKDIKQKEQLSYKYIAMGILIAVPTEILLILWNNVTSFYIIYGHVLKIAYYYCLYKGIFTSLVTYPYKKLDSTNQYYSNILESMGEGLIALDNNYNIAYINQTAEKHSNSKREVVVGKNYFSLFMDTGGIQREYFNKVMQTRIPIHYEIALPYNGRILDGSIYPSVEGITVIFHDITEQKEAEYNQTLLINLIQSTSDGVVTYNCNGIITTWNKGAEKIHGYSASEAMGKHISQIINVGKGEIENVFEKLLQGEVFKDIEITRLEKDGSPLYISINLFPIMDKNKKNVGIASICRDITVRKIMQKELNKRDRLSLVGELAAGIAHEIRNPLTAVRGFLQLLGLKKELENFHTYFQLMIKELDRASDIISEFLSLGNNKQTRLDKNNLNYILKKVYPIIQAEAFAQGKDIVVDYGDIPDLMLDEREIIQLVLNLEKNGLEAMSAGSIMTIGTYLEENEVVLYVKDQGTGIPKEVQSRIGQTFLTTKKNGTGLGLQVCWSIAANHNAKIDFITGPMGTTFFVRFNHLSLVMQKNHIKRNVIDG